MRDGKELTRCAASRNSTNYIALLQDLEADNATGDIFIPTGACWLNLQEGWLGSVGGSSAAMRWPDRVLPTLMRLSKPHALRPLNSTGAPIPGSGIDRPTIIATIAASLRIAFKERSGLALTLDQLPAEDIKTLKDWLEPIATRVGAAVLVTDDADGSLGAIGVSPAQATADAPPHEGDHKE